MKQHNIALGIVGLAVLTGTLLTSGRILPPAMNMASSNNSILYAALLATKNSIPTEAGKNDFLKQSNNLTQRVDPELVDLDSQIITCDPGIDSILSGSPNYGGSCVSPTGGTIANMQGKYLGGQCCSALSDTKNYHENLEKLQAYKSMPDIPLDPMHTPVEMAKKWIAYDKSTILTSDQQKVYEEAYAMSKEKPCCCKCWHYFTNEGIAKKIIKDGKFNAEQIAAYWDASDICGA